MVVNLEDCYLAIDAGTSGGKAAIISGKNGQILAYTKKTWSYTTPEDLDPHGAIFDPKEFWNIIIELSRKVILESKIDPLYLKGVSTTSQRHGCVFLNKKNDEIYAGPNRDARGLEVDMDDYFEKEELYDITGHGPPFLFPLSRLLWFQENEEEIYEEINHFLTIDGWVIHKLTGGYFIDKTSAAETMIFDINKRKWSDKIIAECEIDSSILPEIVHFGQNIGDLSPEIAKRLNLKHNIPVIYACADTQASLIGSGLYEVGNLGIVAGSTMPLQLIMDKPLKDPNRQIWTGCFINNKWVLESNAGSGGNIHSWFIDSILTPLGVEDPYSCFEELINSQVPGANGTIADLGSQIHSNDNMTVLPSGGFKFLPPSYGSTIDVSSFARATIENISYSVRANLNQLQQISNVEISKFGVVGGMVRSNSFLNILATNLGKPIYKNIPEGALLAVGMACMLGCEQFNSIEEISRTMLSPVTIEPNEELLKSYNDSYSQWREFYTNNRQED